jgi:hypothetical protein
VVLAELEERYVRSILGHRSSSLEKFLLAPIQPPSGHLIRFFNWYQSRFGHLLALTDFVTRMRYGERCHKACDLQWQGFRLLKKLNSQLSLKPGSCHLRDRAGGVCDPDDAQQREPR